MDSQRSKATIVVPNKVFQPDGKTNLLLIAKILNQVGFLGDCVLVVELNHEDYEKLQNEETLTTSLWQGQLELFQNIWGSCGEARNISTIFLSSVEDMTKISGSGDFYYVSTSGIKVRSPYASEPISVNVVNANDDIVTEIPPSILQKLFEISKQCAVKVVPIDSMAKGTQLTEEFLEDPGTAARRKAALARENSRRLLQLSSEERANILRGIASALAENKDRILAANQEDLKVAKATDLAPPLMKRLKLTSEKVDTLVKGINSIAEMREPVGRPLERRELAPGLILEKETAPFGVLLVIFESRPDCLPQVVSLSLRSGNGLLLKGGKEAKRSNKVLHDIIGDSIEKTTNGQIKRDVVGLFETRNEIGELLKLDDAIDLIIPRGSGALVRHIENNTRIPVLGHSEGLCHIFVDKEASLPKATRLLIDAKLDYPAACNAVETIIFHKDCPHTSSILKDLVQAGVSLCAPKLIQNQFTDIKFDDLQNFRMEYGDNRVSVNVVDNIDDAITHIHKNASGHTECIITENKDTAEYFLTNVDAGSVYHNASTRMADGFRYGLGAEVGISTKKVHARGPVGVMGLESTKWKLRSTAEFGHCARDFTSKAEPGQERQWTHKDLPLE